MALISNIGKNILGGLRRSTRSPVRVPGGQAAKPPGIPITPCDYSYGSQEDDFTTYAPSDVAYGSLSTDRHAARNHKMSASLQKRLN
jgi:hypothetical protein